MNTGKTLSAKLIIIVFILICTIQTVYSQKRDRHSDDARLEAELQWLKAESLVLTKIATKTEMDVELVPGMVTILQGQDLERKGVRTVLEAVQLVPGFEVSASVISRGIGHDFAPGKTKLLLNGVSMNNALDGAAASLYYVPIEQVERIEFIRGPSSSVYGKWAFLGVINIVTRQNENRVFGRYGKYDAHYGGGIVSYAMPANDFSLSLNLAGWEMGKTGLESGPDVLWGSENEKISNAPGSINDRREAAASFFKMNYRDLSLVAQYAYDNSGDRGGMVFALPPEDNRLTDQEKNYSAELKWESEISKSFELIWRGGWRKFVFDIDDEYLFPPGFTRYDEEGNPLMLFENGIRVGPHYQEWALHFGTDIIWKGWERHTLLLGLEYERDAMSDHWQDVNYNPHTMTPLPAIERFGGDESWLMKDRKREFVSMMIQDQFEMTDRLYLTTGLRYDHYNDTGVRLTPRIASVLQWSTHHIFKAQYAEAFRPPTFSEMYAVNNPVLSGNPDIESETIRTWELDYIDRQPRITARVSLFYSKLDEMIVMDENNEYANTGGADTMGSELELNWHIVPSLILDTNLSYIDTENEDTGKEIAGSSKWLGNAELVYLPSDRYAASLVYRYVSDRYREVYDPRENLSGYNRIDTTVSVNDLLVNGLTLRVGVRNIFDRDIRILSPFEGDSPSTGRELWGQLSYGF